MNLGTATVVKANALDLPLPDESVDLIVTSPPYFALRSYQDGGEHYEGQIGSEPTPADFLEALWAVMAECWRVLKPTGSAWVNLGDKYAGSGGHNNSGITKANGSTLQGSKPYSHRATRRSAPDRYNQNTGGARAKSLMGMPWRFAIGCIDGRADPEGRGWILRSEVVWDKPNGLPESVKDRVRRSHEQWFHFTKEPTYFTGIDEIREPHLHGGEGVTKAERLDAGQKVRGLMHTGATGVGRSMEGNPLGKLPGSVWRIPSEPLKVPAELGIDHFAAFPTEWPRQIIRGWSPHAICTECGEGMSPVVKKSLVEQDRGNVGSRGSRFTESREYHRHNRMGRETVYATATATATITNYRCGCNPDAHGPPAPTRPAVVLDPFGGTGTTAMVAKALGRDGISVDLSADYCRLAEWRTNDARSLEKIQERTYGKPKAKRKPKAKPAPANVVRLFDPDAAQPSTPTTGEHTSPETFMGRPVVDTAAI